MRRGEGTVLNIKGNVKSADFRSNLMEGNLISRKTLS